MQIPILSGIYADTNADFRTSYPRNLIPVPKNQGISEGYLRPAEGIVEFASGSGVDRGGINWNGTCYRAMGNQLVSVSSTGIITTIGNIGGLTSQVSFAYSFDRLAIASDGNLFYWNGSTLTKVTDPDLGVVVDLIWVDGYFMTTDGTSLVVTELNDPTAVNPLKYGSAESDPDPINRLLKVKNEPHAVGRYSIEAFSNVGGNLFPFQRIPGAQVPRGSIGTFSACLLEMGGNSGIAMLGGGKNEAPSIWFAANGQSVSISTREIDTILQGYTESQLAAVVLETRIDKAHNFLYVHLPDQTLLYDAASSPVAQKPVWVILTSSSSSLGKYRARNFIWCYDAWVCGDPTTTKLGKLVSSKSSHYGTANSWEFSTAIMFNELNGAIFHEIELIALTGEVGLGKNPTIWTSYSYDGITWSNERPRTAGKQGRRDARLNWLQQGHMNTRRIQKFRGTSDAHISIARIEAKIEPLRN